MNPQIWIGKLLYIIKAEKKKQGLTWKQIEEKANIPPGSFFNWGKHVQSPGLINVLCLLDALGLELIIRRKSKNTEKD